MQGRNSGIDGLRGLAAVSVVFYHSILVNGGLIVPEVLYRPIQDLTTLRAVVTKLFLFAFNGENAVYVFFVLSGLVLGASLRKSPITPKLVAAFVVKRACRLYPAIFGCFALMYVLASLVLWRGGDFAVFGGWAAAARLDLVVKNALLYQISVHGASWTLQAELIAVPFILVAGVIARRVGFIGLLFCLAYSLLAWESKFLVFNSEMLAPTLPAFFAGMILADPACRKVFAGLHPALLPCTIVLFMFGRLFTPMTANTGILAQVVLAALLVGQVYYADRGSLVLSALNSAPVQFLGLISYSFYLFAVPVTWVGVALLLPTGLLEARPLEVGLALGLISAVCTAPIAALSERIFERPGVRLGQFLSRKIGGAQPRVLVS